MPGAEKSVLADCARRYALGFQSEHTHTDFGVPLRVWHNCVVLTFQPQDKSGRTAKRYQKDEITLTAEAGSRLRIQPQVGRA